jgi:hypothetical protein
VCKGSSLGFSSFGLVMCRDVALAQGVQDLSSLGDLSLYLCLAFDHLLVSFYSFLFFLFSLRLLYVCVVNALIKGEIEAHVWFEDRWMVASSCDELLTTLCGLILG